MEVAVVLQHHDDPINEGQEMGETGNEPQFKGIERRMALNSLQEWDQGEPCHE